MQMQVQMHMVGMRSALLDATDCRVCVCVLSCCPAASKQQQNGALSSAAAAGGSEALEQLVAASGKLALLDRMMAKLVAGGHR